MGSGRKVQICSQPDSQASHESCSPVLRIPCVSIIVPCGKSDVVVEEEGNLQGSLTKEASAKYASECKGQVRRKVPCLSAVIGRLESAPAVGRSMCWKNGWWARHTADQQPKPAPEAKEPHKRGLWEGRCRLQASFGRQSRAKRQGHAPGFAEGRRKDTVHARANRVGGRKKGPTSDHM